MKRIIAAAAALIMSLTCFHVNVSADAECESYEFHNYFEYEESLHESGGFYEEFTGSEEVSKGIYLPVEYDLHDIEWIQLTRNYVSATVMHSGTDYSSVYQYFSKEAYEKRLEADRKRLGTEGERLTYRGTDLLIFRHDTYFDHNENIYDEAVLIEDDTQQKKKDEEEFIFRCIYWSENGHYFVAESTLSPESETARELSHYRRIKPGKGAVLRDGKLVFLDKNGRLVTGKEHWMTSYGSEYYVLKDGTIARDCKKVIGGVMYEFYIYGCFDKYSGWYSTKKR